MKQPKSMSLLESTINILVGFGISLAAQGFFLPLLGVSISLSQNLIFALIMTVISIARSYLLRRLFEALHIRHPLSPFMAAVMAERRRQIEVEGWSPEHDDKHGLGELARAGASYGISASATWTTTAMRVHLQTARQWIWPWNREWWKPTGFRRDLVKAAALIIAEGEKFDRSRKQQPAAPTEQAAA